jgi:hypothetical protein
MLFWSLLEWTSEGWMMGHRVMEWDEALNSHHAANLEGNILAAIHQHVA